MKLKKMTAVAMAAAMVLGNSMIVLADDATSATGTGTAFDHLDKEITTVTLPLDSAVSNVFNYYVDPERLVNDAKALDDGTAVATPNDDGVYFLTDSGYASTSAEVEFEGKNSVDVDITVAATIASAETDIALVADADALAAATTPALLMTLNVGDSTAVITKDGGTAKATIAGVADNFEVTVGNDGYEYTVVSSPSDWNSVAISLSGKTNTKDVPEAGITAPAITLTWTIAKHASLYVSSDSVAAGGNRELTLTLPDGVTVQKVVIVKTNDSTVNATAGTHYVVKTGTFTLKNVANTWASVQITYSDGHVDVVNVTA